jgi:hypothetical protein
MTDRAIVLAALRLCGAKVRQSFWGNDHGELDEIWMVGARENDGGILMTFHQGRLISLQAKVAPAGLDRQWPVGCA